jgi:hypothetical protein
MSSPLISIKSNELKLTVNPQVGGTITNIVHLATGLSVLGTVPWDPTEAPIGCFCARDEAHWLTRYTGGWPLLFPNGGDACTVDGVFHGFHGEASISPWECSVSASSLKLSRHFFTVPVEMERELTVDGELLTVRERLRMTGENPVDVMWGHHPTFGSDLLAGPVEITSSGKHVTVDDIFDPAANPLEPGARGEWPIITGKKGPFDLRHPLGRISAVAYLYDFDRAWIAMRRLDNAIAIALSWDAARFPCAWIWLELGGTAAAPWFGQGNVIGLEPNTTQPGMGIANARARGSHLLRLSPGHEHETALCLHVFKPSGPVLEPGADGRVGTS